MWTHNMRAWSRGFALVWSVTITWVRFNRTWQQIKGHGVFWILRRKHGSYEGQHGAHEGQHGTAPCLKWLDGTLSSTQKNCCSNTIDKDVYQPLSCWIVSYCIFCHFSSQHQMTKKNFFFENIHFLNWILWLTECLPPTIISIPVTYYLV